MKRIALTLFSGLLTIGGLAASASADEGRRVEPNRPNVVIHDHTRPVVVVPPAPVYAPPVYTPVYAPPVVTPQPVVVADRDDHYRDGDRDRDDRKWDRDRDGDRDDRRFRDGDHDRDDRKLDRDRDDNRRDQRDGRRENEGRRRWDRDDR